MVDPGSITFGPQKNKRVYYKGTNNICISAIKRNNREERYISRVGLDEKKTRYGLHIKEIQEITGCVDPGRRDMLYYQNSTQGNRMKFRIIKNCKNKKVQNNKE